MSDINKDHRFYDRAQWTDAEPDTLYVSIQSSRPDSPKYFVFSGNATWLSIKQAVELRDFLTKSLRWIQRRERRTIESQTVSDEVIDTVAQMVWKEGLYNTPWEKWSDKERWRKVARDIAKVLEEDRDRATEA